MRAAAGVYLFGNRRDDAGCTSHASDIDDGAACGGCKLEGIGCGIDDEINRSLGQSSRNRIAIDDELLSAAVAMGWTRKSIRGRRDDEFLGIPGVRRITDISSAVPEA